jgi:hypothetical protein
MTEPDEDSRTHDVPREVSEKFLQALSESGASSEMVSRLRKVLLDESTFNESVLRAAIFGEESLS